MRQTQTRILSLLLALVMCLGLLPGTALAADITGSISPNALTVEVAQGDATARTCFTVSSQTELSPDVVNEAFIKNNLTVTSHLSDIPVEISTVRINSTTSFDVYLDFNTSRISGTASTYTDSSFQIRFSSNLAEYVTGTVEETYATLPLTIQVKGSSARGHLMMFFPNGGSITEINGYSRDTLLGDSYYLDRNGFGIELTTKAGMIYADGSGKLPCFPTVTRSGRTFEGWYIVPRDQVPNDVQVRNGEEEFITDFGNGNYSQASLSTAYTGAMCFVAKWSAAPDASKVREVWFNPNGGTAVKPTGYDYYDKDWQGTTLEALTDNECKLPVLPTATREGYTFDGWYTAQNAGTKVSVNMDLSAYQGNGGNNWAKDQIVLWAHWTQGNTYTVKFDLNGAPGTPPAELKVSKTDGVMTLPANPVWSGHTFQGWISGDVSGTQITNLVWWNNGDKVTSDLTLYAAWKDGEANNVLKGLTYQFGNNRSVFGYSSTYKIPLSRYQMVFGNTALAKELYDWAGAWGGSCYAMAATSGMFFQDGDVAESTFRSGAGAPYDLAVSDKNGALNMTLTEYIEAVFVTQLSDQIQADYQNNTNLNTLCAAVKSFKETGKNAPVIAISGSGVGHAVLGYDVVDVSDTEARLMVYDPNYPSTERYITLGRSNSQYTSWSYMINDKYNCGTGRSGSKISYVPYADYLRVWTGRAQKANTAGSAAILSTNVRDLSIANSAGTVVATVKNGELTTSSSNIYPIQTIGITSDDSGSSSANTLIRLPVGGYTVTNTGTETNFKVSMVNVDQSAAVTTNSSSVTFLVNDSALTNSVQVDGKGKNYSVTLYSTLSSGYEEVVVTGVSNAEAIAVAQISGKLYGTNLNDVGTITVNGKISDSSILAGTVPTASAKPSQTNPFTDVSSSAYYYDAVLWAVGKGVTTGTGDGTTFSPNDPCTRAQIVTFLWRAYGKQKPTTIVNPFTDVKSGDYYYDAVLWAVEKGITAGTGDGTTFSPNDPCTRAQAVTFQWRAAGKPAVSGGSSFTDVVSGSYYADAVAWAVVKNITTGATNTTFNPNGTCTRGQIVTFLYRGQGT